MNIFKQKYIKILLLCLVLAAGLSTGFFFITPNASADAPSTASVSAPTQEEAIKYNKAKPVNKCGDVSTFFKFPCGDTDSSKPENSPIFKVLLFFVNILTTLVGLAAVGGIIAGGIIYSSAGDNAEQTKKGITYVVNAVIAIFLFAFMFAILNFIIPGGLLN